MVKSRIRQGTRPRIKRRESLWEAIEEVNTALLRLVRNYRRELEAISLATRIPHESGLSPAAVEFDGFQYVLMKVPLLQLEALTDRQRRIALFVAEGLTNKEVGNRLAIRPATVASHLRVIYKKLNIDSRAALLRRILSSRSPPSSH